MRTYHWVARHMRVDNWVTRYMCIDSQIARYVCVGRRIARYARIDCRYSGCVFVITDFLREKVLHSLRNSAAVAKEGPFTLGNQHPIAIFTSLNCHLSLSWRQFASKQRYKPGISGSSQVYSRLHKWFSSKKSANDKTPLQTGLHGFRSLVYRGLFFQFCTAAGLPTEGIPQLQGLRGCRVIY